MSFLPNEVQRNVISSILCVLERCDGTREPVWSVQDVAEDLWDPAVHPCAPILFLIIFCHVCFSLRRRSAKWQNGIDSRLSARKWILCELRTLLQTFHWDFWSFLCRFSCFVTQEQVLMIRDTVQGRWGKTQSLCHYFVCFICLCSD